jgi:hypothetical protein
MLQKGPTLFQGGYGVSARRNRTATIFDVSSSHTSRAVQSGVMQVHYAMLTSHKPQHTPANARRWLATTYAAFGRISSSGDNPGTTGSNIVRPLGCQPGFGTVMANPASQTHCVMVPSPPVLKAPSTQSSMASQETALSRPMLNIAPAPPCSA